jgi:ubiquinone/menaquinone biosynthesis C-methylase UbiE
VITVSNETEYPDHFVERLHTIWGEGFLSPGGPEEVREIVEGIDLVDKVVLDVGFGTGGPAIALATNHLAKKIVGIDVESNLYDRAKKIVGQADLAEKIELKIVKPGPFPFDDETFDIVFSKDSMVQIEDKAALFTEIKRVLKPGGVFVASDWLASDNPNEVAALDDFLGLVHWSFAIVTARETETALKVAGFENVSTRDRNAWFADISNHEVMQIEGPLKQQLIEAVGEELWSHWIKVKRAMADAASAGGLRPTHLRGFKPNI